MAEFDSQQNQSQIKQLLADYAESLYALSQESQLSPPQIIKVLRSRDRLQEKLSQDPLLDDESLAKLVELDLMLKKQADRISQTEHLDQLRQSLQPPDSAWWWYFEPPAPPARPTPLADRFDWLWNLGTVACLVIAGSFMSQTVKAFSIEGLDLLGTFSTISQGAGLVFVAGGALTDKGRKAVSQSLSSMRIPASLHAEATFAASLVLLGTAYGIHRNLNQVGYWYFNQGQSHEQRGEWSQAFKSYKRALNFDPDDYKTQIAIGFLHEKLSNFNQAIEAYEKGSAYGIPEFLNAQGRAMLMGALQENNWQGGIDEKVSRKAQFLLDRADQLIRDSSNRKIVNERDTNFRLQADIKINQAIAQMATLKSNQKPDPSTQKKFVSIIDSLFVLKPAIERSKINQPKDLAKLSTVGEVRSECYEQLFNRIANWVEPSRVRGVDIAINDENSIYICSSIIFKASVSTVTDKLFLDNYQFPGQISTPSQILKITRIPLKSGNISTLMNLIYYSYDTGEAETDNLFLIQEPKKWLHLANQLSNLIKSSNIKIHTDVKQKIIWRVIVSENGNILGYFAYDSVSLDESKGQPFLIEALEENHLKKLVSELKAGKRLEFADFKVVLSPQGKLLHLVPWSMAYPAWNERCRETCKNLFLPSQVNAAFKSYTPDLNDPAELGTLKTTVTAQLRHFAINNRLGWYYEKPSLFQLRVSSDGQVIDYKAMNDVARQTLATGLPLFPDLKSYQYPHLEKAPYTDLTLEVKGIFTRLAP